MCRMRLSLCFHVGMLVEWWWALPSFWLTQWFALEQTGFTFDLWHQEVLCLLLPEFLMCLFANCNLTWMNPILQASLSLLLCSNLRSAALTVMLPAGFLLAAKQRSSLIFVLLVSSLRKVLIHYSVWELCYFIFVTKAIFTFLRMICYLDEDLIRCTDRKTWFKYLKELLWVPVLKLGYQSYYKRISCLFCWTLWGRQKNQHSADYQRAASIQI